MDLNNANKNAERLKKTFEETESIFGGFRDTLQSINEELGKKVSRVSEAKAAYSSLTSIAQTLQQQEEGRARLSDKELDSLLTKATIQKAEIARAANLLAEKKQSLFLDKNGNELNKAQIPLRLRALVAAGQLKKEEQALLLARLEGFEIEQDTVDAIEGQVETRKKVNASLGLAGGILKGINEIAGGFGKALNLDKVQKDMEEFSDKFEGNVSRVQVLAVGLKSAFINAADTLTDPSFLLGNLIKGFHQVNKAQVDYTRLTGEQIDHVDTLNMHYLTSADYIKAATELTKEFGMAASNIFTPEDITEVAEMTEEIGIAGDKAAQLAKFSKLTGGSLKANNQSLIDGVNAYNKQNKSAVNGRMVLDQVANVSDSLAVTYAGYPEKLAGAAAAAQRFGISLQDVEKIADSLLNFEQSISAELEAELLTGKSLNLEKAREAALNNDLETLTNEISKNVGSAAEFGRMNRLEQEAMAKAVGMNKDELAGMLIAKEIEGGLNKEALTDAQKQQYEQYKSITAQEKFNKSIEKLQQSLAPIIGFFADILSNIWVIYGVLGAMAVMKVWKNFGTITSSFSTAQKGASTLFGYMKKEGGGIGGMFKDIGGTIKDKWMGGMGKVQAKSGKWFDKDSPQGKMIRTKGGTQPLDGAGKGAEGLGKSADQTKGVQGNKGKDIKQFLKGLGDGLKYIGDNFVSIVKGGLALLLAAPGLIGLGLASPGLFILGSIPGKGIQFALEGLAKGIDYFGRNFMSVLKGSIALGAVGLVLGGSFALAMMMVKDVDPAQMLAFAGSLTMLGLTMALLGNIGANVIMGAVAMGILALSLIPAAFAFSLLAGVDVGAMIAFSIALPLLALATAGLGFLAPFIMAGAGALAVLGLALIPASMAFGMIAGLDTTAIISFSTGIGILALAAAGLGFLAPFIIFGSVALAALGTALIPASEAFGMIAGLDTAAIISFSTGIGILATTVAGLGFLAPFIIFGSVALSALGLALVPLSKGFESLASVNVNEMMGGFIELASLAPGLTATAAALFAVAGGMTAVAVAGYLAVPAMALMSMFSSATGGEEGAKDEGSMKAIEQKLDQLIAVVSEGGDVYIDGSKVGKTLQLASSKMG